MLFQILIFAAIAGFLLYRLYTVLGRRTGHMPSPQDSAPRAGSDDVPPAASDRIRPAFTGPGAAGMEDIRRADGRFDPGQFVEGARGAYEMIVEAFANGDRETLQRYLAEPVYERYETAIDAREEKNQTQTTDIVRLAKAEIEDAELDGKTARVKVHFEADLSTVVRDAEGEIVEGDPSRVRQASETWTFERDVKARDPNWVLTKVARS